MAPNFDKMIDVSEEFGEARRNSWYSQVRYDPNGKKYYGYTPAMCAADVGREWYCLGTSKEEVYRELELAKR